MQRRSGRLRRRLRLRRAGGAVSGGKTTLTTTTEGATIYYTLTGSDPRYDAGALTYTAPLTLSEGDVLRACAVKTGLFSSDVT